MKDLTIGKLIDKLQMLEWKLGEETLIYIDLAPGLDRPELEIHKKESGLKYVKIC